MRPYAVVLEDLILNPTAPPAEAVKRAEELKRAMFVRAIESDPYFRRTMATPLAANMKVSVSQTVFVEFMTDEANKLREEFLK